MRRFIPLSSIVLLLACACSSPQPRRQSTRPVRVSSQEPVRVAGANDRPKNQKKKKKPELRIRCVMNSCLLEPDIKVVRGTDFDIARTVGPGKFACPPSDKPHFGIDAQFLEPSTHVWILACLHYKFDPLK